MIHYGTRGFDYMAKDSLTPLLLLNSQRGAHSTGLFGVEVQQREGEKVDKLSWIKKVGSPYNLALEDDFRKFNNKVYNEFQLVVGHGRFATRGNVNAFNAHPFVEGDITLVHNGTLNNLWDFKVEIDGANVSAEKVFEVDSNAAAYFLAKQSPEEFFGKVQGAFVFMWYDRRDKQFHIVRNTDRPLYLVERGDSPGLFFSSEQENFAYLGAKWPAFKLKTPKIIESSQHYTFPIGEAKEASWEKTPISFRTFHHYVLPSTRQNTQDSEVWDNYWNQHNRNAAAHRHFQQGGQGERPIWNPQKGIYERSQGTTNVAVLEHHRSARGRHTEYRADGYLYRIGQYCMFYVHGIEPLTNHTSENEDEKFWTIRGICANSSRVEMLVHRKGNPEWFREQIFIAGRINAIHYIGDLNTTSASPGTDVRPLIRLILSPDSLKLVDDDFAERVMQGTYVVSPELLERKFGHVTENLDQGTFVRLKNSDQISVYRFEEIAKKGCARCEKQIDITDAMGCLTVTDGEALGRPVSAVEHTHGGFFCPDCVMGGFSH